MFKFPETGLLNGFQRVCKEFPKGLQRVSKGLQRVSKGLQRVSNPLKPIKTWFLKGFEKR